MTAPCVHPVDGGLEQINPADRRVVLAFVEASVKDIPGPSPARIRYWARLNGIDVGRGGRLPKRIRRAFEAAHMEAS